MAASPLRPKYYQILFFTNTQIHKKEYTYTNLLFENDRVMGASPLSQKYYQILFWQPSGVSSIHQFLQNLKHPIGQWTIFFYTWKPSLLSSEATAANLHRNAKVLPPPNRQKCCLPQISCCLPQISLRPDANLTPMWPNLTQI